MEDLETTRIIYPQENGVVAIVAPIPNCGMTLEALIELSVPQGVPYKVVDISEIPTDRTFRNAWEYVE